MRTTWWVVCALGFQHGSGRKPVPRPLEPPTQTIHCATLASDAQQTPSVPMPARTDKPNLPSFPANFVLWDMKKVTKMKWWHDLADVLPQIDSGIRSLVCRGTATGDKCRTVCSSDRQVQDLERNMAIEHTFQDPAPAVYVPRTPPTDPAELAVYNALAAVTAPDVSKLQHLYIVNPQFLLSKREATSELIIMACQDETSMREQARAVAFDGLNLMRKLYTDAQSISPSVAGAIETILNSIEKKGVAKPDHSSFLVFKREYESWNRAMHIPHGEPVPAYKYSKVVRKLGPSIAAELSTKLTVASAETHLPKTLACIDIM